MLECFRISILTKVNDMNIEKKRSFIINFLYFAIILLLAVAVFKYLFPLLTPFIIAFVISYILNKLVCRINKRFKINKKRLAILLVILFYCTIGVLLANGSISIFYKSKELITKLPQLYEEHAEPLLSNIFTVVEDFLYKLDASKVVVLEDLKMQLISAIEKVLSTLYVNGMAWVIKAASSVPSLAIKTLLMIISTFFITIDYDKLTGFCMRQFSERTKDLINHIQEYVVGTLFVCIKSYALIMSITFVELSIGLAIVGVKAPVLIAFCIAIFDILPVLGTGGIMIPWVIISLLQGKVGRALGLLIVYVVITVIRNIIEPKIVGSQIGLHPVVTLASMFVGVQLLGVIGLFGFPITLSLLKHLNDNGTIRIFK